VLEVICARIRSIDKSAEAQSGEEMVSGSHRDDILAPFKSVGWGALYAIDGVYSLLIQPKGLLLRR
jgi:hypothetical protein